MLAPGDRLRVPRVERNLGYDKQADSATRQRFTTSLNHSESQQPLAIRRQFLDGTKCYLGCLSSVTRQPSLVSVVATWPRMPMETPFRVWAAFPYSRRLLASVAGFQNDFYPTWCRFVYMTPVKWWVRLARTRFECLGLGEGNCEEGEIANRLRLVPNGASNPDHGTIQPNSVMPMAAFKQAIAGHKRALGRRGE
jgi:hypothetical protein